MFAIVVGVFAQRSFEDLGTPLANVTFCVVDLETTGGSPAAGITEIGALKMRGGETTGSFQTLVNPGEPVPAFIRLLTGISDELVAGAPSIEQVLPSFLEFIGGAVLVAHNARFDTGFLDAALRAGSYRELPNRVVDTARLARKILAGEVPNNRLATLARYLRCAHQPCHRAYADVLATADVLHCLIERATAYGVTTLEDLLSFSTARADGTLSKLALAKDLPSGIGIYRFVGSSGATLYVGKATCVRSRVRSYFYGDARRKTRDLLRETAAVSALSHATLLEAEIAEARAIASEKPPYNRTGKRSGTWYLKLTIRARVPKVCATRVPKHDGSAYMGPFPSMRTAHALLDAMRDGLRIHRCSEPARCRGCVFSELRSCVGEDAVAHRRELGLAAAALAGDATGVLEAVSTRMLKLSRAQRFEEAAEVRERGADLQRALMRTADVRALLDAGEVVLAIGTRLLLIRDGRLEDAVDCRPGDEAGVVESLTNGCDGRGRTAFVTADTQREAFVVASWLRNNNEDARLLHVEGTWALPVGAAPSGRFHPKD
jgi:DNA polymerase III subunit epsilon